MKGKRQAELLKIILEGGAQTQEQLLERLEARGFKTTQATISRDIKELRLVKETVDGVSRYVRSPAQSGGEDRTERLRSIFKNGVSSFDSAQNIVVVKTMPGLAGAAGAALDGMEIRGFVGSLAGDDTVVMIMRTDRDAQDFLSEVRSMLT